MGTQICIGAGQRIDAESQQAIGDVCVVPRGLSRISLSAVQKVKVEYAIDDIILQRGRRLVIAALDIHPRRAEQ